MVSNNSKWPNSARNAKMAAVVNPPFFYLDIFYWPTKKKKMSTCRVNYKGKIDLAAIFYERYQTWGNPKRFYPIISKTKEIAPIIKLLVWCITRCQKYSSLQTFQLQYPKTLVIHLDFDWSFYTIVLEMSKK